MSKRVVRVISIEGNPDWVDSTLAGSIGNDKLRTLFTKKGTIKELQRVELKDDEFITIAALKFGKKEVVTPDPSIGVPRSTLEKWQRALEPHEFGGPYGERNNDGVCDTIAEIGELLK